jgi:hypothetical protein
MTSLCFFCAGFSVGAYCHSCHSKNMQTNRIASQNQEIPIADAFVTENHMNDFSNSEITIAQPISND